MSLRNQLNDLLTEILPSDPADAIKGTELIRLARLKLGEEYSDASLRYHFSIMSCDPYSPIAKVEKGQGYYRRSAHSPALSSARELLSLTQGRLDDLAESNEALDEVLLRIRKFRAIVVRYFELNGRFPFLFREAFGEEAPIENFWKYPDAAVVDWQHGKFSDQGPSIDAATLALKQQLGLPAYQIQALRLRLLPTHHNYLEDFYQTLSASHWAQGGELIYAAPIKDEALADSLRRLSQHFGIGVTSFGLDLHTLDELPRPANILNAHPNETEALLAKLEITRLAAPKLKSHLDWEALNSLRIEGSPDFDQLFQAIQQSFQSVSAKSFADS